MNEDMNEGVPPMTPEERAKAAENMELLIEGFQSGGEAGMLKVWNELFGGNEPDGTEPDSTAQSDPYGGEVDSYSASHRR